MSRGRKKILSSSLSDLVEKFSQQNIVEEIEKRYQNAPSRLIPIGQIEDTHFVSGVILPEDTVDYFASRLREKGFYNPLVVRPKEDGKYEIILGRKRFYGAMRAGYESLPCAFAEVGDEEMLLMLLADTRDQREANVIELAVVCQHLQRDFGYTQETLAELSHQSRCQISNILRVLGLPDELLRDICLKKLSYGHGRALTSLPKEEAIALAKRIEKEKISVRDVEKIVRKMRGEAAKPAYEIEERGLVLTIRFKNEEEKEKFKKAKLD